VNFKSKKFNPRENLTVEQSEILNEFIEKLESERLTTKERKFCDEACLLRYLRARDWDVKKANKLLRDTLAWREEYKPELITAEELSEEACTGKMFRRGFDKTGKPVLYMAPGRENSTDYVRNVKLLIYTMERAIESMPEGVEQMVFLIDFNNYSRKNVMPYNVIMEVLNILSNHYPERLGAGFLIDSPWLFSLSYKAISPFINPVTKSKVHFVSGSESAKEQEFSKYFDMSTMERRYGGTSDFEYNHEVFWKAEIELDKQRILKNGLVIPSPSAREEKKLIISESNGNDWPEEVEPLEA